MGLPIYTAVPLTAGSSLTGVPAGDRSCSSSSVGVALSVASVTPFSFLALASFDTAGIRFLVRSVGFGPDVSPHRVGAGAAVLAVFEAPLRFGAEDREANVDLGAGAAGFFESTKVELGLVSGREERGMRAVTEAGLAAAGLGAGGLVSAGLGTAGLLAAGLVAAGLAAAGLVAAAGFLVSGLAVPDTSGFLVGDPGAAAGFAVSLELSVVLVAAGGAAAGFGLGAVEVVVVVAVLAVPDPGRFVAAAEAATDADLVVAGRVAAGLGAAAVLGVGGFVAAGLGLAVTGALVAAAVFGAAADVVLEADGTGFFGTSFFAPVIFFAPTVADDLTFLSSFGAAFVSLPLGSFAFGS